MSPLATATQCHNLFGTTYLGTTLTELRLLTVCFIWLRNNTETGCWQFIVMEFMETRQTNPEHMTR